MDVAKNSKSLHPVLWVAAVAVTIFSLVGIGAVTGLIPTAGSQSANKTEDQAASPPPQLATAPQPPVDAAPEAPEPAVKPAHKPEPVRHDKPKPAPARVAQAADATTTPPPAAPAPVAKICADCGVIDSIRQVEQKGQGTGIGAVGGAVAGGVLGHQTGNGRGRDVMTVLGAIAGGFGGNEIEKHVRKTVKYEVAVRMEDGSMRNFTFDQAPSWHDGDRVRVVDGQLVAPSTY